MKQFKIEVSHASPQQLATIGLELKIMSNAWTRYGPRIMINGAKLQAPSLTIPGSGRKRGPRSGKPSKQVERLGEITRGHKPQARHN
jgi:hypothetical protein